MPAIADIQVTPSAKAPVWLGALSAALGSAHLSTALADRLDVAVVVEDAAAAASGG